MNESLNIVKPVVKMIIDSCILPGTALGAEIVWVYCREWKNQISMTAFALISFAYLLTANATVSNGVSKPVTEQENIR